MAALEGGFMDNNPNYTPERPFRSVESAWFWTIRAMHADPLRATPPTGSGRQLMQDVIKCLDNLYRNRRIDMLHVRIIRIWGLRGLAPNPSRMRERSDWRIWHEAMDRLDHALQAKGIVSGALFQDAAD